VKRTVQINDLNIEFKTENGMITEISVKPISARSLKSQDLRDVPVKYLLRMFSPHIKPKKAKPEQWKLEQAANLVREFPLEPKSKLIAEAFNIKPESAANLLYRARKAGILIDC
jgi:hypothetical protein